MTLDLNSIKLWLNERNERESIFIFVAGLCVVYLIWNILFEMPLQTRVDELAKKNALLATDILAQKEALASLENIINNPAFKRSLALQQQLSQKSQTLGGQLNSLALNLIPEAGLKDVTNDLIRDQNEVSLRSLKTFASEPWVAPKSLSKSISSEVQDISKHRMQLEFLGTYFSTIEYFTHLEKLPWHIYWDSLDYKVTNYPQGDVIAQFYILSNEKS